MSLGECNPISAMFGSVLIIVGIIMAITAIYLLIRESIRFVRDRMEYEYRKVPKERKQSEAVKTVINWNVIAIALISVLFLLTIAVFVSIIVFEAF